MKAGGRILTPGRERLTLRRVMVVTQIAVSLVLVVAALLFVRSFVKLITFDPGMRQADITIAYIGFGLSSAPPEQINTFQRQLLAEVNAIPGVLSAASTTNVPLLGSRWGHGVKIGERDGGSMLRGSARDTSRR